MGETYVLAEYSNTINDKITSTFQETHRIKFTSFDVSRRYVVFGASSGGIYIFDREPFQFRKLIPSKHGHAVLVSISDNDECLAIGSSSGMVIILEECFNTLNPQQHVYSEHEGQTLTAMTWSKNILFCGDNAGKVTSIVTGKLIYTLFTSNVLLSLESPIVQLDVYGNYLLVSSYNRTVICDTEKDVFKQIGKKPREGAFGACFFDSSIEDVNVGGRKPPVEESIVPDINAHSPNDFKNVKIFCARPGARLWQAKFDATVVFTHQFRDSLNQKQTDIIHLDEDVNARFASTKFPHQTYPVDFNFGKLYKLFHKFILTYSDDGFYLFNPSDCSLMMWCGDFDSKPVRDVKLVDSSIYVWYNDLKVRILQILSLESLIVTVLQKKQYYLCAQLCCNFYDEIVRLIEVSQKIFVLSVLNDKVGNFNGEIAHKVQSILHIIREKSKLPVWVGPNKGIVTVPNVHSMFKLDPDLPVPIPTNPALGVKLPLPAKWSKEADSNSAVPAHSSDHSSDSSKSDQLDLSSDDNMSDTAIEEQRDEHLYEQPAGPVDDQIEDSYEIKLVLEQFRVTRFYPEIETAQLNDFLANMHFDSLHQLLKTFRHCIIRRQPELEAESLAWCKEIFLKQLHRGLAPYEMQEQTYEFALNSFLAVNFSKSRSCQCEFPLPTAHTYLPKYYAVGKELFEMNSAYDTHLHVVPYMYKMDLDAINDASALQRNLPLLVQFSDRLSFNKHLNTMTYDLWDEAMKLLANLRRGKCLKCNADISMHGTMDWKTFATLMVTSVGSRNAIQLLQRNINLLPNTGEFDGLFYQYAIFNQAAGPTQPHQLGLTVTTEPAKQQFGNSVAKFLTQQYLSNSEPSTSTCKMAKSASAPNAECDLCHLPLQTPVIDDAVKLGCEHVYHKVCLLEKDNKCCVCDD